MTATIQRRRKPQAESQSTANPPALPDGMPSEPICRITVEQYHEMIRAGILSEDDPIELLEGWLVRKTPKNTPHAVSNNLVRDCLAKLLPAGWSIRVQDPVTLFDSEPEPDIAVVRGSQRDFNKRHPTANELEFVAEIADTSISRDKGWKKSVYARAGIPVYWIIHLAESSIEVFTEPKAAAEKSDYGTHQIYSAKQKVPVVLNGKKVGTLLVADVLP